MNKQDFRRRVRETRRREWIREAVRAREYTCEETLKQGVDLINFALRFRRAGKDAGYG